MRMRRIVFLSVTCQTLQYFFSNNLINDTIFGKKLLNLNPELNILYKFV